MSFFRQVGVWQTAVILLFLALSAIQSPKPLHLDEADLPVWAKAVADTGVPIAYRGEARPRDLFVYHVPLYIYVLGAWIKLFGYGPAQIRLFGAFCAIVLGVISLRLISALFGPAAGRRVSVYFWPFFLLNPYTLQTASIADIDTTIYGPLLCGFLLSVVILLRRRGQPRSTPIRYPELIAPSLLLCLCFWTKWTTILVFLPAPFLIFIFRYGWKTALRLWLALSAAGFGLFVLSFALWCSYFDVSYTTHLRWLTSYTATSGASRLWAYWMTLRDMAPFVVKWTGMAPWIATVALLPLCIIAVRRARDERGWILFVVLTMSVAGATWYAMQRHTFGQAPYKYHFVFWGLICLPLPLLIASRGRPFTWAPDALSRDPAVSTVVSADVRRSSLKWRMAAAVTFSIAALIGAVVLQDRPLRAGAALWHYAPYWLAPPLVAASAILILRSEAATRVILLSLLLVCVGLQTGMCIYQVQQPYSTTYNYGQEGITAAAAYIRSITRPTDIVFCMKDIGPLCQRRFYESYDYMYRGPDFTRRGIEVLTKYVNVAVFTEGLGEDQLFINPEMQCWVANHCTLLRNIGNYRIYAVRR